MSDPLTTDSRFVNNYALLQTRAELFVLLVKFLSNYPQNTGKQKLVVTCEMTEYYSSKCHVYLDYLMSNPYLKRLKKSTGCVRREKFHIMHLILS